jgi:hypothetical protein
MAGYVVERRARVKSNRRYLCPFHVKLRTHSGLAEESGLESQKVKDLFTNAEIAEDHVQDILHIDPPRQPAKCLSRHA